MRISRAVPALAAAALMAGLSGCAGTVPLQSAEDANDPGCADVIVRLPDSLGELQRRDTNAQATGAWGSPPAVLLYCGVEVPSASTQRCVQVDGIYWLVNGDEAPSYILRSYGREPAVDVVIDTTTIASTQVLQSLSRAVSTTASNGHACTGLDDAEIIEGESGSGGSPATDG